MMFILFSFVQMDREKSTNGPGVEGEGKKKKVVMIVM